MSRKTVARYYLALAPLLPVQLALAANTNPSPKPAISDFTRPLSFEPNQGQTDRQVDFLAHGAGYRLFLSHAEAVMALDRGVTVRMRSVGGKPSSPEPLGEQPSRSNYFIGNDPHNWHTGIANYARVRYRAVYPGIDLIYYGNQRQLEYDFVVSAGADPNLILLQFQGGIKPALDRSGDLLMHTPAADLRWRKPVAYQEINGARRLITCAYAHQTADRVGFEIGAYDRTKPLVIDPELVYSTYLGGSGFFINAVPNTTFGDRGTAIAVDRSGNAYVTGATNSSDFPVKNGFQESIPGIPVAFVTKFDPDGNLIYSTFLGGSTYLGENQFFAGDQGNGIAVDAQENAYITGYTWSYNFPTTSDAFQPHLKAPFNAFVTKLNASGNSLVYSTFLGGTGFNCLLHSNNPDCQQFPW
jgi:hypothetical protein